MALHSRRELLTAVGTAGVASLAGCVTNRLGLLDDDWPTTTDDTTEPFPNESAGWPQYGRGASRTGFARTTRVDDPSEEWTFTLPGSMAPPVIVGDQVIVHGGGASKSAGSER